MEPIPETLEAIGALDPYLDDGSLWEQLTRVASDEVTAALDGVQYLTAGPCVDGLAESKVWPRRHRT